MAGRFGARRAAAKKEAVPEAVADIVTPVSRPVGPMDFEEDSCAESRVEVAHYSYQNWGARHDNEDRWMHQVDHLPNRVPFHTVGVLDGHDTELASDAVSRLLPDALGRRLKDNSPLVEAYVDTMREMEDTLKGVHASAGTCVNSCTIAGRYVWCANLGDCRAALVLLKASSAAVKAASLHWMSKDHKASSPSETKRIREAGGMVMDGRVEGLEPSRTLGDFDVKASVKEGVISIVPEVRRFELGDGAGPTHAVLVCGTDGVWDTITGQDVCDLINARKELATLVADAESGTPAVPGKAGKPLQDLAQDVVQFAVARGSRDDCTCIAALISVLSGTQVPTE